MRPRKGSSQPSRSQFEGQRASYEKIEMPVDLHRLAYQNLPHKRLLLHARWTSDDFLQGVTSQTALCSSVAFSPDVQPFLHPVFTWPFKSWEKENLQIRLSPKWRRSQRNRSTCIPRRCIVPKSSSNTPSSDIVAYVCIARKSEAVSASQKN